MCKHFSIHRTVLLAGIILYAMSVSSCADTLLTSEGFAGKPPEGSLPQAQKITVNTISLGVFEVLARATSATEWLYFDFESGQMVTPTDPLTDNSWDIALQRFKVKINGGNSGNGANSLLPIIGQSFDSLTATPSAFSGAITDRSDAGDGDDACRPAEGTLYAYLDSTFTGNGCWFRYENTQLIVRDVTYVHKTHGNRYYKVRFFNYYSSTGTSGHITFRFSEVGAP